VVSFLLFAEVKKAPLHWAESILGKRLKAINRMTSPCKVKKKLPHKIGQSIF